MSGGQYTQGMQAPTGFEKYVRPEHIPRFSFLSPDKKSTLSAHVLKLWNAGLSNPRESQESVNSAKQLASLTRELQRQSSLFKLQQQQAQAQAQAQAQHGQAGPQGVQGLQSQQQQQSLQGQQVQAQTTQQASGPVSGTQLAAQNQDVAGSARQPNQEWAGFKADLEQRIRGLQPPLEMKKSNPEEARKWVEQQSQKARHFVQLYEQSSNELSRLQRSVQERMKVGNLTDEEKNNVRNRMAQIKSGQGQAQNFLVTFRSTAAKNQKDAASADSTSNIPGGTDLSLQQKQDQPGMGQPQIKNEPGEAPSASFPPQQTATSQNVPLAATAPVTAPAPTPSSSVVQPPATPASATSQIPTQVPVPSTQIKTETSRPTQAQTQPSQQNQQQGAQPQALSHQAAIDRARNHSQAGPSVQTPTSAQAQPQHGHPAMPRAEPTQSRSDINKHTISKQLNVTPLQPVGMPAARPTLSGGPGAQPGVMSQPGLQKHPGYVLEGEGERVLSEKKLEELMRQVTGSVGGEGSDSLDPEVKETLLDLADEFVDNVIMSACRVAKLRSSSTLELRDIQLILERNYNIRVPGYASDELRTVKKIQPSQAWAQKMSAVQAAKVTGGKTDI